jgi:hypothetical protein
MYNPTINQKKRETKINFHQNGIKKNRGRPEEEKLHQETGLPEHPTCLPSSAMKRARIALERASYSALVQAMIALERAS